jgi:hypothetical protein
MIAIFGTLLQQLVLDQAQNLVKEQVLEKVNDLLDDDTKAQLNQAIAEDDSHDATDLESLLGKS